MVTQQTKNETRAGILWMIGITGLVLGGYFLLGRGGGTPEAGQAGGGGNAPSFALPDLNGRSVSLSDFAGKVVVLDFWATWCPPCRREIPDFISLQKEYGKDGVQFVGIALDEPGKVRDFVREYGINYPIVIGDDAVAKRYGGIEGIPTTFIIDRQGRIVETFVGFRPREAFEKEIRNLL